MVAFGHYEFRYVRYSCLIIALLAYYLAPLHAKSLALFADQASAAPAVLDTKSRTHLEARLLPYFRLRAARLPIVAGCEIPTQQELWVLSRNYSGLSTAFKAVYTQAYGVPAGYRVFVTPKKNGEIWYTLNGSDKVNGVDSLDTMGYDTLDWRTKKFGKNNIPDYIDEVAFAFDSTYAMIIDRFGFSAPLPADSRFGSPVRYKIIISALGTGDYAITTPGDRAGASQTGFRSEIILRNSWKGPPWDQAVNNYDLHPELAVRVTIAHEFFHAVQYGMARTLGSRMPIDEFPLQWLESSAVMMEELAFSSVNDYIQYANDFYARPSATIFSDFSDPYQYSLLVLYLYYHADSAPGIAFIKDVFLQSQLGSIDFFANLDAIARRYHTRWLDLLSNFFTAAYFSGARGNAFIFIPDASQLPMYTIVQDQPDFSGSIRKSVAPMGMQMLLFGQEPFRVDSLHVSWIGTNASKSAVSIGSWNISMLYKTQSDALYDTIVPFDSGSSAMSSLIWGTHSDLVMIATNGVADSSRIITGSFTTCDHPVQNGYISKALGNQNDTLECRNFFKGNSVCQPAVIFPEKASVSLANLSSSNIQTGSTGFTMYANAALLSVLDSFVVTIKVNPHLIRSLCNQLDATPELLNVYFSTDNGLSWQIIPSSYAVQTGYTATLFNSGICIVGGKKLGSSVHVYPNPIRYSSTHKVHIIAKDLLEVRIFSAGGKLLTSWRASGVPSEDGLFQLETGSLVALNPRAHIKWLIPGIYWLQITSKDPITKGIKSERKKMMVVP